MKKSWTWVAGFFVAALVVYGPVFSAGFIWDDAAHVVRPALQSLDGLRRIWFEIGATQQYYPVVHTAFWLEHLAFGDSPMGYHGVNVLLHAAASCLFAGVLRRLDVPGAWFAAGLFLLHPVSVESVAWISEQKNTLSLVGYLLAALAYLRFDASRRRGHYAIATAFFLLALGSKTVTASLPAALLLIFWWKRGRLEFRRDVAPLLPWFCLALLGGMLTSWVEREFIGARDEDFALNALQRVLLASRVIWFYFGKLVYPVDLIFIYPRWKIDGALGWQFIFPLGIMVAAAAAWHWRRQRGLIVALLFFVGSLFPALGFVNVYPFRFSYVADHFQYLASLGIFALAGAGLTRVLGRWPLGLRSTIIVGGAILLGTLTWRQSSNYRTEFALYEATLAKNPNAAIAHNNLGNLLVSAGRSNEALPHFDAAVRLVPQSAKYEYSFAFALMGLSNPAAAVPHFERTLQIEPDHALARYGLGMAWKNLGRADAAEKQLKLAVELNPALPEAHFNLGVVLGQKGDAPGALENFAVAVRLNPQSPDPEFSWAVLLVLLNRLDEAWPHFERAGKLAPNRAYIQNSFGRALIMAQRLDEGMDHFRQAIQIDPNFAEGHANLAEALRQSGRTDEAARHFAEATRLGWKR